MNPYKEILRKFFSEYVGALRKRRGLTQEQMVEKLRITGRAYSDLERGIYCFFAVALVFLLLMLEEGEIKELLSPLRDEIEKVEGREVTTRQPARTPFAEWWLYPAVAGHYHTCIFNVKRSVCVAVDRVWETERETLRSITK